MTSFVPMTIFIPTSRMGYHLVDQYSLLHFAVGIIAYFWSISLGMIVVLHIVFEYVENTPWGMNVINTYFKRWWPGGKTHADNLLNQTSDVLFAGLGWIISYYIDRLYS